MSVKRGARTMARLEQIAFDNQVLKRLPIDSASDNYVRTVKNACFSRVKPTPVDNPVMVVYSPAALGLIGLDPSQSERADAPAYFAGNDLIPGSSPAAHCYCGHQFGSFAGQLGDGATMYLGECLNDAGERWELQFKGAGKTPYSRTADGRKVLRSSIREFLASEANAALGIPTTRSGTVVTSDTRVVRDVFYSGNPIQERATIITRIAPTFLRFGSFQICNPTDPSTGRAGPSHGNLEVLKTLVDFTISQYFPAINATHPGDSPAAFQARVLAWFGEVCRRTARLVASWQCLGFCHGVLNTDNMSIYGITIDYGPYGWMERFDPGFVCNSSDDGGRYTYDAQPSVCRWNCGKLAEALAPLLVQYGSRVGDAGVRVGDGMETVSGSGVSVAQMEPFRPALQQFLTEFRTAYNSGMRRKLGLGLTGSVEGSLPARPLWEDWSVQSSAEDSSRGYGGFSAEDELLVSDLLSIMHKTGADWTNTWRALGAVDMLGAELTPKSSVAGSVDPVLDSVLLQCASAAEIAQAMKPAVPLQRLHAFLAMALSHPAMMEQVPLVEAEIKKHDEYGLALSRSDGDKRQVDAVLWSAWLARYRSRLGEELPSECTTDTLHAFSAAKRTLQSHANPTVILRNWVAQLAIQSAEEGDYTLVRALHERLNAPYDAAAVSIPAAGEAGEALSGSAGERVRLDLETLLGKAARPLAGDASSGRGVGESAGRLSMACRTPPWALDMRVT